MDNRRVYLPDATGRAEGKIDEGHVGTATTAKGKIRGGPPPPPAAKPHVWTLKNLPSNAATVKDGAQYVKDDTTIAVCDQTGTGCSKSRSTNQPRQSGGVSASPRRGGRNREEQEHYAETYQLHPHPGGGRTAVKEICYSQRHSGTHPRRTDVAPLKIARQDGLKCQPLPTITKGWWTCPLSEERM